MAQREKPTGKVAWVRITLLVCLAGLVALGGWAAWATRSFWLTEPPRDQTEPPIEEPVVLRPAFVSPFLNTKPGVKYVGDATCAECHAELVESYRHHPMGRALAPVTEAVTPVRYDPGSHNPFVKQEFRYQVERRGGRIFHKETRTDAQGRTVAEIEAEIHYALGSGTRGYSFLVNREGHLFQSPISWFTQNQRWDLAPGYEHRHQHFERPISAACLFCHCNRAEPAKDAFNRFEPPIFQGYGIGCERCHGPGELHVKSRQIRDGVDYTIVNPRHLEPALREGVCQQCHLQGDGRILRPGKELYDYRPGLPLHEFLSIFVRSAELTDNYKAVSQVEQMHFSKCFKGSSGLGDRLGCVSCHDPHRRPAAEERIAFYRERCLNCHGRSAPGFRLSAIEEPNARPQQPAVTAREGRKPIADSRSPTAEGRKPLAGCSVPEAVRRATSAQDSCMDCHMPRSSTPDIAHTAMSDHRILRKPDHRTGRAAPTALASGDNPLVQFHRNLLPPDDRSAGRELGIALVGMTRAMEGNWTSNRTAKHLGGLALPRLDAALKLRPNDVPVLDAKAYALWVQGRGQEAIPVYEAALAANPRLEATLDDFAMLLAQFGRRDEALARRKLTIELNPWQARYRLELAKLHAEGQEWAEAEAACREALRLNPALVEARTLLVKSYLRLGKRQLALQEYETLLAFDPPNKEELRRLLHAP